MLNRFCKAVSVLLAATLLAPGGGSPAEAGQTIGGATYVAMSSGTNKTFSEWVTVSGLNSTLCAKTSYSFKVEATFDRVGPGANEKVHVRVYNPWSSGQDIVLNTLTLAADNGLIPPDQAKVRRGTWGQHLNVIHGGEYRPKAKFTSIPNLGQAATMILQVSFGGSTLCTRNVTILAFVRAPNNTSNSAVHSIERLYRAHFLRASDAGGLEYWVGRHTGQGLSLPAISNHFAASQEFQARYGNISARAFVDLVYRNVLNRAPDAGGYNYWLQRLHQGMSRGEMMLHFSESAEYRARTRIA